MEQKGGGGAGGAGERVTRKRRIERGPGGERREEPTPRVLALLLTDSTFLDHYVMVCQALRCLRHTAAGSHSSYKTAK